jgi:hypothetical protein
MFASIEFITVYNYYDYVEKHRRILQQVRWRRRPVPKEMREKKKGMKQNNSRVTWLYALIF